MKEESSAIESIFSAAVEIENAAERAAFVGRSCGADAQLQREVEELLTVHFGDGSFLETPANLTTLPTPSPPECAGTLIGPYKLLEQIGEGGMGVVYLAEQQQPVRRRVALKIIKPGMDTRQVIARFEAERQALALMEHPNIAKVFDAGATESGRPYFVMELVRGIAITDYCDQAKLPIPERLKLFITVCRAVQHAHQKGIIHRDIKPNNILVTLHDGTPVPKVIDFGIAKATGQKLTEHTLNTGFAHTMGTPAYMSPEQTEPSGLDIDTRSDIYSLGVLLYELLTGHTPFDRETLRKAGLDAFRRLVRDVEPLVPSSRISTLAGDALSTVADCRASEPRKLSQLVRGEPDWLVMKALEKDRDRRYETASALAADVERYLNNEPVQACPPSKAYRLCKFLRRNKGPVVAATVVFLALAIGITGTSLELMRALAAEDLALTRLGDVERASAQTTQALEDAQKAKNETDKALSASEEARGRAVSAEKKADDEAAVAHAVSEFLSNDLLAQAGLHNQSGDQERDPDVKARTLLDRAAKTIEGKFKDQPLTEAALRLTIGNAYQALGQIAEAQAHLERSLAICSAKVGPNHPDTLNSEFHLANVYLHDLHRLDLAERLYTEVIDRRTTTLGANHPDTQHVKNSLAKVYMAQGNYDVAEPLINKALETQTVKLGAAHPYTAASKLNLAILYAARGKYDLAEALYKELIEIRASSLGADHPDTLWCKLDLAKLYMEQRKYDRAEFLYAEVLDTRVATLGPDLPVAVASTYGLAQVYQAQGKGNTSQRVAYLDDLEETESGVWGVLGKHGDFGRNSLKVVFEGRPVAHTLGMHPPEDGPSYVVYDLRGEYATLYAKAAIAALDGEGLTGSPLTFKVFGDGKLRWQSDALQRLGTGQACVVNIQGVKTLRLEAHHGGHWGSAHAAWLRPMISKIPLSGPSTSAGMRGSSAGNSPLPLEAPTPLPRS